MFPSDPVAYPQSHIIEVTFFYRENLIEKPRKFFGIVNIVLNEYYIHKGESIENSMT